VNESKNLILAVVLSALVLLGWTFLSDRFVPANPPPAKVEDKAKTSPKGQPGSVATGATQVRNRAVVLADTPRVRIETPSLRGSINLKGARIDDLWLLKHRISIKGDSPPVPLLSPQGSHAASFVGFGWNSPNGAAPNNDTVWKASAPVLSPGKPVTLSWTNPAGQTFQLIVSIDDLYLFNVDQRVVNPTGQPIEVQPYSYASRAGRSADASTTTVHIGPISVRDGKADYKVDWKTVREAGPNGIAFDPSKGWIGFTDKYWLAALAAQGTTRDSFRHSDSGS